MPHPFEGCVSIVHTLLQSILGMGKVHIDVGPLNQFHPVGAIRKALAFSPEVIADQIIQQIAYFLPHGV